MMHPCRHSQYQSGIPGSQRTESVLAVQRVSLRREIHVDAEHIHGQLGLDPLINTRDPHRLSDALVGFEDLFTPQPGEVIQPIPQRIEVVEDPGKLWPRHIRGNMKKVPDTIYDLSS